MLSLDGSYGEGGGQILRTALALAALTGVPVRIERIRARRSKPGLRPQHLTAVQAVARVSQAEVTGAHLGSQALTFRPRTPQGGHYRFDVAEKTGSAGAVTLVAQALLPPLVKVKSPATVILKGGTHVPWSPPAHYLSQVFLPALAVMGAEVEMALEHWGWYPRGGGEVRLTISGARPLIGVQWHTPAKSSAFRALSAAAKLPEHVARRQAARLTARLDATVPVEIIPAGGLDPGSLVFVWGPQAGFAALGARGKPAEQVADEAAEAYLAFRASGAALDRHLADQILIYLALAKGPSRFTTEAVTSHLLTNVWVIEQFLGPTFEIKGALGERGEISCQGQK
ncbi:MAG: RNA 3'-phosphate cyclase [Proteobacteria bacterium]|nr:RNA 3'-phosphate cyclase [Pseudomonadota bacterium]